MNKLLMQLPKNGYIKMLISLLRFKNQIHKFDREHYLETGKKGYPLDRITNNIKKNDLILNKYIGYLNTLIIGFLF